MPPPPRPVQARPQVPRVQARLAPLPQLRQRVPLPQPIFRPASQQLPSGRPFGSITAMGRERSIVTTRGLPLRSSTALSSTNWLRERPPFLREAFRRWRRWRLRRALGLSDVPAGGTSRTLSTPPAPFWKPPKI